MFDDKSKKLKAFTVLPVCLVFAIMAFGLVLASCEKIIGGNDPNKGVIVFSAGDGGSYPPDPKSTEIGGFLELPGQGRMEHSGGKVLSGWKNEAGETYSIGAFYPVTKKETLTAQWRDRTATVYTVLFEQGEGSGTPPAYKEVTDGTIITMPRQGRMTAPIGKEFEGWKSSGSSLLKADAPYKVTGNITFAAQWKTGTTTPGGTTYTITYNINGGSGTTPNSQTVTAGSSITLNAGSGLLRSGYTFGGWNASADGTGANYPGGSTFTPTGTITLYAKWNAVSTYTVTYNINGGSGTTPNSQTVTAGSSITLNTGSGLLRSGYTFGGWNASVDGTGANYPGGSTFTPTGTITLYAKWNAVSTPTVTNHTVTYYANGGDGTPPTQSPVPAGTIINLASGNGLSKTGFTFIGWTANSSGTDPVYYAGNTYRVDANTVFYAKWDAVRPAAPTNVKASNVTGSSTQILVTWNPVPGDVVRYNLYYTIGVSGEKIPITRNRNVLETTFTHNVAVSTSRTSYYYYITAINSSNIESEYSAPSNRVPR